MIREHSITLAFAAGVAAIVLYVGCAALAWWVYPGSFTPLQSWLSSLGDPSLNPVGAAYYNVGCILTGAGLLLFVLGLGRWHRGGTRGKALAAAQVVGFASAFFLVMLGLHSQERLREHLYYSNRFFISFPVFIALLSTALFHHPCFKKSVGVFGFGVVLAGLAFHGLLPESRPLEWITEFGFAVYVALVAWNTQNAASARLEI